MRFTSKTSQQNVVLLLLGLDNAGKTVIANRLRKEDFTNVLPTIGFSMQNLNCDKHNVFLYELGGSEQIRNIWPKYYLDAHGLIFVVDSSDLQRLAECQHILNEVVCHKQINGKPILIFANKQDCEGALDEIDIVEKLGIEDMVNKYQCPTLVQPCSAVRLPDPNENIESGYNWLLTYIHRNYTRINNRVIADTKSQQEQDIKVKKPSKTKQQKIMNGCFGDSWVSKNIEECPSTPKELFF
ncbi:ADP-ribosylation factor-like protein 13B [Ctenocephalides felis]|uniref:ADP-ribosylation factor-like protein 13B n=1 Tax=Ctenocephalides felis TaxID=7515 RepID=UPI000E6E524D|nr:ADP-ribosylation factor-like protein 13B [Ctenocephalides felis]